MRDRRKRSKHGRAVAQDHQKSVFDRLGRQLEAQQQLKRHPISPSPYSDYGMPPPPPPPPPSHQVGPIHEPDYSRYGRDMPVDSELEWRYHERRQMPAPGYNRDERPLPQPSHQPPLFELDMPQSGPYHLHLYHGQPQVFPPQQMSSSQRASPKYDRHGNPIMLAYRDGEPSMMRMPLSDQAPPSVSPSRNFMGPGAAIQDGGPSIRPSHRWYETEAFGPELQPIPPHHYPPRMLMDDRFNPLTSGRYQSPQPALNSIQLAQNSSEASRHTKWRERRDVITNLDRETAQSSFRTDSLKFSLQQVSTGRVPKSLESKLIPKQRPKEKALPIESKRNVEKKKEEAKNAAGERSKPENLDISDGEIVDDEDSDSEDSMNMSNAANNSRLADQSGSIPLIDSVAYSRRHKNNVFDREFYPDNQAKKRRLHDREDYSLDYETISDDEDLEDIMAEKELNDDSSRYMNESRAGSSTVEEGATCSGGAKKTSEIELLKALGLDWANLVDIAKHSRDSNLSSSTTSGSSLARFSVPNYLPTLGISTELVGPKISELVSWVCRA